MVRLSDIAARARTSVSTVSIVLSDRPSPVRISAETREAVLVAARELGYSPNLAARRLRRNGVHPRTIVLAIAYPVDSRLSLVSRSVSAVQQQLSRLQGELEALGAAVQLTVETFQLGALRDLRGLAEPLWFNGVLVSNISAVDEAYLESLTPGVPLVAFQRYTRHSSVNTDNVEVGRLATQHLIDLGHRRIALVTPDTDGQAQVLRLQGYRNALQQAGLAPMIGISAPGTDWAAGAYNTTRPLLDRPCGERPSAIFATNDLLAIGVMRAVRDHGLHVPDDISVVGCDDAEFTSYLDPPLTTIHLPLEEMAARATTILLDLIYQRATAPVQEMFPSHLVIRRSTEPFRDSTSPQPGG